MSTSRLQEYTARLLYQSLGAYTIKENYRPDWLIGENGERLELDLYVPELNVAIEVQGKQHYTFTPFFHKDYKDFEQRLARDDTKRDVCKFRGILLIEVSNDSEAIEALEMIMAIINPINPEMSERDIVAAILDLETKRRIKNKLKWKMNNPKKRPGHRERCRRYRQSLAEYREVRKLIVDG